MAKTPLNRKSLIYMMGAGAHFALPWTDNLRHISTQTTPKPKRNLGFGTSGGRKWFSQQQM
jgi:hypothetical protein